MSGLRWPSAATPKPPERSMYSRPCSSQTRQPSARAHSTSAPSSNTRLLLARDHTAREPTLALAKAAQPCRGRVRPLAWCSRPRSGAALLEGALGGDVDGNRHEQQREIEQRV